MSQEGMDLRAQEQWLRQGCHGVRPQQASAKPNLPSQPPSPVATAIGPGRTQTSTCLHTILALVLQKGYRVRYRKGSHSLPKCADQVFSVTQVGGEDGERHSLLKVTDKDSSSRAKCRFLLLQHRLSLEPSSQPAKFVDTTCPTPYLPI